MDRRPSALNRTLFGLVTALAACESGNSLEVGMPVPSVAENGGDLVIAWVMRPEDRLACQEVAMAFRRIARKYGPATTAVVVLGRDKGLVRSLLTAERLENTQLIHLNRRAYRRLFGNRLPPFLFISERNRVLALWSGMEYLSKSADELLLFLDAREGGSAS